MEQEYHQGEVIEAAKKNGIQKPEVNLTSAFVYRDGEWQEQPKSLDIKGDIDIAQFEKAEEFKKVVGTLVKVPNVETNVEITPMLIGAPFPVIKDVIPVLTTGEKRDLVAQKGIVYLFDFWATWCGPCQMPMQHNQDMLTKNPDWEGKVKIVGVSIDDDAASAKKRVEERKWTKVEHYNSPGGWGSAACKQLKIRGIPFCVLVDSDGIVQRTGHPSSMQLDKNIPLLVKKEKLEPQAGESGGDGTVKDKTFTYDKCKTEIQKFVTDHPDLIKSFPDLLIAAVYIKSAKVKEFEDHDNFLLIRYMWSSDKKDMHLKLKSEFETTFGSKIVVKVQERQT